MCDDDIDQGKAEDSGPPLRSAESTPAPSDGAAGSSNPQAVPLETDVEVKTADGVCDAALIVPKGDGRWPAVLIWTDVMGLKAPFRAMGARLASHGYVVLVPNPYYRWKRAPIVEGAVNLDDLEVRGKVLAFAMKITNDGIDRDSRSFLDFLDAQPQTDRSGKAGVHGYCMGGRLAFRTAAAVPDRIAAVGNFHGFGLVTDDASSPHLLIAETRARYLVAIARNDDAAQPEAKEVLRKTFADTGHEAEVTVYPADHGWCVRGVSVYDEAAAERAWGQLEALYGSTLG